MTALSYRQDFLGFLSGLLLLLFIAAGNFLLGDFRAALRFPRNDEVP